MRIREKQQLSPIADEVLALVAVVRPILIGVLYALKKDVVKPVGSYENVTLALLSRLYKPGDGDCGKVRLDESKNLVICPLLHDGDFMQLFYEGWQIVQAFIASDAGLPKEVMLPRPSHREVARMLRDRREFPVVDVVEALRPFAQPELLVASRANAHHLGRIWSRWSTYLDTASRPCAGGLPG